VGFVEVVKTIKGENGLREVRIVRNSDGSFGFEEWGLLAYPGGQAWEPMSSGIRTFADSPEAAEREARIGVNWLISQHESEADLD
jgi:hypothetical protein